ncbi:MAG: FAD-dependent oxidoreductase [Oscillospiraceae bacterium]|nr:FAD-dependent oxidoreductase [Oscillospiraceae bacterium]
MIISLYADDDFFGDCVAVGFDFVQRSGDAFFDFSEINQSGIFVAIGVAGSSELARKMGVEINGNTIVVDSRMATNIPGLYAVGDCTGGMLQIAKSVYQGAVAGTEVIKYIKKISK